MASRIENPGQADVLFNAKSIVGEVNTGILHDPTIGDGNLAASVVKDTFDQLIRIRQQAEPYYRKWATVRPANLVHPGHTFDMFQSRERLELATTPLDEYGDPDYVPLPPLNKKSFTVNEYGNATVTTLRLRDFSWASIDPLQAYMVADNMGNTVDKLVENVLMTGANEFTVDGSGIPVAGAPAGAAGPLTSGDIRRIVAGMRAKHALPFDGGLYVGFIHPAAAVALREETDAAGWRPAHQYTENTNGVIFTGDIGIYEGVRWIETTRVPMDANGNYCTFILGRDGLLEALNREFSTVVTPTTDKFNRLSGIGWFGCAGWGIYNEEAVVRVWSSGDAVVIDDSFGTLVTA